MSWPDGRSYEGEFVNDMKHGIGIYIWGEKVTIYFLLKSKKKKK